MVPDDRGVTVHDHFTLNLGTGEFPVLMVQQRSLVARPVAMPHVTRWTFTGQVWGIVQHFDPAVGADLVSEFAAGLCDVANSTDEWPLSERLIGYVPEGVEVVGAIDYGTLPFGSEMLYGFSADVTLACETHPNWQDC